MQTYRFISCCRNCCVSRRVFFSMGIKVLLVVLAFTVFCMVFYEADWKQCIFFSGLNYSLYFLPDLLSVQLENILVNSDKAYVSKPIFLALPAKLAWLCVLFILRKVWKGRNNYGGFPVRSG